MAQQLHGIPKGAELWKVGPQWYAVYVAPGTDVPIMFYVESGEQMARILGAEGAKAPRADRTLTREQMAAMGAVEAGRASEVIGSLDQPFEVLARRFDEQAQLQPSLRDPEVRAAIVAEMLRGGTDLDAAVQRTDYWKSRTAGERAWEEMAARDPATARQRLESNVAQVRNALAGMGYQGNLDALARYYGELTTHGKLTDFQLQDALRRETDPFAPGASPFAGRYLPEGALVVRTPDGKTFARIDGKDWEMTGPGQQARYITGDPVQVGKANRAGALKDYFAKQGEPETGGLGNEERVRSLVQRWLGPLHAKAWEGRRIAEWAGKMRTNPNAEDQLVEELRNQRLAAFPTFENKNLAYEDIAPTARSLFRQVWGQDADELDPLFHKVLKLNDEAEGSALLREQGLRRGVETVQQSLEGDAMAALGGTVRRTVR